MAWWAASHSLFGRTSMTLFSFQCRWFLDVSWCLQIALHMGIDSKSWNPKAYTHDHIGCLASTIKSRLSNCFTSLGHLTIKGYLAIAGYIFREIWPYLMKANLWRHLWRYQLHGCCHGTGLEEAANKPGVALLTAVSRLSQEHNRY